VVKGIGLLMKAGRGSYQALALCLLAISFGVVSMRAQSLAPTNAAEPATIQSRIERARSLAAIGSFTAAASELETILAGTNDDAVRDVARILLMGVYLKQSNYPRADNLLDESFKARTRGNENTTRVYFALAGSLVNGVRSRLDRYREFGLNAASLELPAEARSDIDQLRVLLERVVEQARQINDEENSDSRSNARTRNTDTVALLEDAASVRLTLARTNGERTRWQREVAEARQRLISTDPRSAMLAQASVRRSTPPANAPANTNPNGAAATSQSAGEQPPSAAEASARDISSRSTTTPSNTSDSAPEASAPASPPQGGASGGGDGAATRSGAPVAVGSLLERATQKVQPAYPQMARNMGLSGVVVVYLLVNERGEVEAVERASGPQLLQRPATDAARRWKFRPTIVEGQPVRVSGYISFNFAL
jgi:TonB family protein